jgi:vacuolar-type H+-ATPase subunit H
MIKPLLEQYKEDREQSRIERAKTKAFEIIAKYEKGLREDAIKNELSEIRKKAELIVDFKDTYQILAYLTYVEQAIVCKYAKEYITNPELLIDKKVKI